MIKRLKEVHAFKGEAVGISDHFLVDTKLKVQYECETASNKECDRGVSANKKCITEDSLRIMWQEVEGHIKRRSKQWDDKVKKVANKKHRTKEERQQERNIKT